MGQCLCRKRLKQDQVLKQDKNIDDKRMFELGIDVLNRDFCKGAAQHGPPENVVS